MRARKKRKQKAKRAHVSRSAKSGKFVGEEFAKAHPATTVRETVARRTGGPDPEPVPS